MSRRWQDIGVTPGSVVTDRLPHPLAQRRVLLRPDSLAAVFATAGARLGADQFPLPHHARPWARLFQKEPAYLYAQIISFRADDAGFAFAEALEYDPDHALALILSLAKDLEGWVQRIRSETPMPFSKQLDQMDKEIKLTQLLDDITSGGPSRLLRLAQTHRSAREAERVSVLAHARATRERLRSIHALLRNAVSALHPSAQTAFDLRIRSGQMDPGLGLLIAELRTAAHVDAAINALPDRHTTLYYSDIIGQTPAPPSPETVLLDLGRVPRAGFLAQGSVLDARLPSGALQRFETDAGVPISAARVTDIRMLSYETKENISYNRALGGITGVRAATLDPAQAQGSSDTLFAAGATAPTPFGLDIASPMLSLAEGSRRVEVSLHLNRGSNLPGVSRRLTKQELAARDEQTATEAHPSNPRYADPEIRLALGADPALMAAFFSGKPETAIEQLTHDVTLFADQNGLTTSLGMIYQVLMDKVTGPAQLRLLLGRIVTLSLIEGHPFPAHDYWDKINALVQLYREDLIGKTPADAEDDDHGQNSMIFAAFSQKHDGTIDYPPEDVFQSLLGDAFDITVTTDEGPRAPDIMQVGPLPLVQKRAAGGITLSMRFDSSAPALTGPKNAPCLALRYAAAARLCPVSFFEAYAIETITIRTQVSGLRRLAAFSDDAPLVTDQTFQPFGPRPSEGASFQVGCAEMARKPVTRISIDLDWSAMPDPIGGFRTYYETYGSTLETPAPALTVDYLSGDGWKPVSDGALPLFQTETVTGALLPKWTFSGGVSGHSVPATGPVSAKEYQSRQTIRAGLVRLRLSGTADGFHAARYPLALVDAMRPRLVPKLGPRKVPPAPFVPEISHLTLSYTAESTIELNAPEAAGPGEEIHQIGPFGSVSLYPHRTVKQARLFPKRLGYGQLCFQLSGPDVTGPVALVLAMSPSGHLRRVPRANPVTWFYLAHNGWQPMPETAISSDTTTGLMRSGIVVLDLPDDATDHSTEMPAGGVWIAAVATQPDLAVFPPLARASINGVWARRSDLTWKEATDPRKWSFNPAQTGLTDLREIATPSLTRPPEPRDTFVARVGERLRHRKRAVTPWDMERMVLEEFPEVWMAKGLPHLSQRSPEPAPGHTTLVVTRKPPLDEVLRKPAPALFDVSTLERIRTWLSRHSAETAQIDVVNPTFERLQVRAKIAVSPERENGAMAQMLRRDLARRLSVWTADASLARFGWSLNVHMLRAHIAGLDYVEDITDFSVLHLVGDDSKTYQLMDTAQDGRDPRGPCGPVLQHRFPWSLPLSTADHILTIVSDLKDETPSAAGIGSLTLGDMLIVGQRIRP